MLQNNPYLGVNDSYPKDGKINKEGREPSVLDNGFEDAYLAYKSFDFLDASRLLEKIGRSATKQNLTHIASKCYRILGKIYLMQGDALAASQFLAKSDASLSTLRVYAKMALLEYRFNHNKAALHFAKKLLLHLLESNVTSSPKKILKIHALLLELLSDAGELFYFDSLLTKFKRDNKYNQLNKRQLLLLARRIYKTYTLTSALSDNIHVFNEGKQKNIVKAIGPINETYVGQNCISFCREFALNLHRESNVIYSLEIDNDTTYETILCIIKFLVDIDKRGVNLSTSYIGIKIKGSDPFRLNLTEHSSITDSNTTYSLLSHRQGQREIKRRAINTSETSSVRSHNVKRFWIAASYLITLPRSFDTMNPENPNGNYSKHIDSHDSEMAEFNVYPSDIARLIKYSTSHYNLRNAHVLLAASNYSYISEKTSRFIMDKKLISLLEKKSRWNALELCLYLLDFLLKNFRLFEKYRLNYAVFVSYLYSTIHKNICNSFCSNSDHTTVYEANPFKYKEIIGDNYCCKSLSAINSKLGVRLLFIIYRGFKLSLDGSFKPDFCLFDVNNSRELMRFVFDLCSMHMLQLVSKNAEKPPYKVLFRSRLFYICSKMLMLTKTFAKTVPNMGNPREDIPLDNFMRSIITQLDNDKNVLYYNTLKPNGPKYMDTTERNTHFNYTYYSHPTVVLGYHNLIKKLFVNLKRSFHNMSGKTNKLETVDSIERVIQKKLNDLSKRLFLMLNEFADLTHIYNIHRYKSPISDWSISHFSWDSVYSMYQNCMSSNEDKNTVTDGNLCLTEIEETLLYATTVIAKEGKIPKWTGQILFVLGDILSFIALNLQKTNIQTFVNNNDCNLDVLKRFGITPKALCTIAVSLLCIINSLDECRQFVDATEIPDSDEEETYQSNTRGFIVKDFLGFNLELLNDLHTNFNCFEGVCITSKFSLTFHPLITRILLQLLFIINFELRNLNHLEQGLGYCDDHTTSYLLFTILSQVCAVILLSPFNLTFVEDTNGTTFKIGISPLLCIVDNTSDENKQNHQLQGTHTIKTKDADSVGKNLLEQDRLFSILAIFDSLLQIETIYNSLAINYIDWDMIPEGFRKFISTNFDGTEFTDMRDKVTLGFPLFLFNKFIYLFDTSLIRYFDFELEYICNSIHSVETINILNDELTSLFSRVASNRFKIRELSGFKKTKRIFIPRGEEDAIHEILQKCFSLIYVKNRDISYSPISALLAVHLRKNFAVEKKLTCNSVVFINDRTDKEYIYSAKRSLDSFFLPHFEDRSSKGMLQFFKVHPDPLILHFDGCIQYYDDKLVLYNRYIEGMTSILETQSMFDYSHILSALLTKPLFNFPPSFKGIYMKLIKQYCAIDLATDHIIKDPTSVDDLLAQLDVINIASVVMPKSMDVWFCSAIKNIELFLWYSKRNEPKFSDTRSFFPTESNKNNIMQITKRTLYLIDITIQTYSFLLSEKKDISHKFLENILIPENIFFGDVELDSSDFPLRLSKRCRILLFSKCTILLYLLKMGENVPCRILLDSFSQILDPSKLQFHHDKGFEKVTRNFNSSPNDRVSNFLKGFDSNYNLFYESGDMTTFYLKLKILERIAKSFYLSKEVYIKLWSSILCGYCDYLAISLKINYLSYKSHTGDNDPFASYFSLMHILNIEFMAKLVDGRVNRDIILSFCKLHISRLRLCYFHPDLFYIAFPFQFSESKLQHGFSPIFELETPSSADMYMIWAKKMHDYCQISKISKNQVVNDAFSALLHITARCSIDISCKLYFKLSHYHYRMGNMEESLKFIKESCEKAVFTKQNTNYVGQDTGYLRNCRKMAILQSKFLFDIVSGVIAFSKTNSDREHILFSTHLKKLNENDGKIPSKSLKPLSKPQGTWLFAGFKSLKRLDYLVDVIDLLLNSLQKANRKFKQLLQSGDTTSQMFFSLIYVQDVLYNALASSFILLVASCPHFLSLPIMVDIMDLSDVTTIAETESLMECDRARLNLTAIVDSLFSLVTEETHVKDINEFLKEKNALYKSSIFVKYGEHTATLDMRMVKRLSILWNSKLFQKPTELSDAIGKSFHSACTKLLYMAPSDSIKFKNSKTVLLVEGNVVKISDEWVSTLRLVSPQKAAAALNEAINKHKDDIKVD